MTKIKINLVNFYENVIKIIANINEIINLIKQ